MQIQCHLIAFHSRPLHRRQDSRPHPDTAMTALSGPTYAAIQMDLRRGHPDQSKTLSSGKVNNTVIRDLLVILQPTCH